MNPRRVARIGLVACLSALAQLAIGVLILACIAAAQ